MPPPEPHRRRWIGLVLLFLVVIFASFILHWWASRNTAVAPASIPVPAPTPSPLIPPSEPTMVQPVPTPVIKPIPKPIIPIPKKPIPKTPVVPVVPVKPVVPVVPPPYIPPAPPPPAAETLDWSGTDTSITHEGQIVVRTEEQWIHFWTEHHPDEASPDVDFARYMVVGIFVGTRPADQFAVLITNVQTQSKEIQVSYRERNPPTGTFAMGVSVHPYVLKAIPRSPLKVNFVRQNPEQP